MQDQLTWLIHREGPITFDRFVEIALYDADGGFFSQGRGAGRSGRDFVTSPEVGPLFGALVATAIDRWWRALGAPDPFLVVEAGSGSGRLAREVLRSEPACVRALRYVLVERSAELRARQRDLLRVEPADEALGPFVRNALNDDVTPAPDSGPVVAALDDLPALEFEGVVFANELLDNLPFGIAQWDGERWAEVRVGAVDGRFVEMFVPAADADARALGECTAGIDLTLGSRMPIPRGIEAWLAACATVLRRGYLVCIDYSEPARDIVARGGGWLRTYREHRRGGSPFDAPGEQDITADIVTEQLLRAAHAAGFTLVEECSQAEWLRGLGVEDLVADARRAWDEGAATGHLEAIAARSRVSEAAALTDPSGLGAHRVFVFVPASNRS